MANYQLRALSVGEILDGAFSIYRAHFPAFLSIGAVCYGPGAAIRVYATMGGGPLVHPWPYFIALIVQAIGGLIASAATMRLISDVYLGREPNVGASFEEAFGKMWPLLVAGMQASLLIGLGFLLLIVPGIMLACRYSLVSQVVVLEDPDSASTALTRSRDLTAGFRLKALGLACVLFLIFAVPGAAAGLLPQPAAEIVSAMVSLLIYPVFPVVFTLLYYDLRVRKEAFDLDMLGRQTGEFRSAS